MSTAESAYYPRWGAGVELGGSMSLWYPYVNPAAYAYFYGYTPGVFSSHGLRLTAKYQRQIRGEKTVFYRTVSSTLPRGFADAAALMRFYPSLAEKSFRVSADYAMPFYIGDPCIFGSFLSIRRLVLIPHFDYTRLSGPNGSWEKRTSELWSAGATLSFDLRSILWMWIRPTLGVTFSYNGGGLFDTMSHAYTMPRFYVAPVISFSF